MLITTIHKQQQNTNMTKASIVLLLAILALKTTWGARCYNSCQRRLFVCPRQEDYVWSIVDGVCRVFQNECYFSAENCKRRSECKCEITGTSRKNCLKNCPDFCPEIYAPICAEFPNSNTTIANDYCMEEFPNRCFLDSYACHNPIAYIGEPTIGRCQ